MKKSVLRMKYKDLETYKEKIKDTQAIIISEDQKEEVILKNTDVSTAKDPKGIKTRRKGKRND